MSLIKFFYLIKSSTKGSVIVFTALAMTVLVGFTALVVDVGMMYFTRGILVKTSDAAALAGVQEFVREEKSPQEAAEDYLSKNGYDPGEAIVLPCPIEKTVEVELKRTVIFSFARVLGFNESEVMARSKAVIGPLVDFKGAAPLCISEDAFNYAMEEEDGYGEPKYFNWDNGDIGPGNYGALALGGGGASTYQKNLEEGYQEIIAIEDLFNTETGGMTGGTRKGVEHLIDLSDGCDGDCQTGESLNPNCPLLIYIPIIEGDGQGTTEVEIIGFSAFHIDPNDPPTPQNNATIKGTFIERIEQGEINPDPNAPSYGVYGVKLIE